MSDIKVGDLVVVVKPKACCGNGQPGYIFRVIGLENADPTYHICCHCGAPVSGLHAKRDGMSGRLGASVARLKRIPPMDELERDQLVKELTV